MTICPYCAAPAELVAGAIIYPHRSDLAARRFWLCRPCNAWVGCHQAGNGNGDGTRPLGRLADAQLRAAKRAAHAAFDPRWKTRGMTRGRAYAWLAQQLGLPIEATHIGDFDLETCHRVIALCR
jgi:hypothetical protein